MEFCTQKWLCLGIYHSPTGNAKMNWIQYMKAQFPTNNHVHYYCSVFFFIGVDQLKTREKESEFLPKMEQDRYTQFGISSLIQSFLWRQELSFMHTRVLC